MKRSRRRRQETTLSHSVHKRLNSYALAASAAGVGALALAQPAEAKIIYTPAHKTLHNGEGFYLDLNHDGLITSTIPCKAGRSHCGLFKRRWGTRFVCPLTPDPSARIISFSSRRSL
jgi:hypothetical protein